MATPVDLSTLAQQIAGLSDAQALDLLSSIEALTARAHAHKTAMAAAEAQRDAWAEQMFCRDCGQPATIAMQARWEVVSVRPGICTVNTKGGLVASDADYASDPPSQDADVVSVSRDLWVSCGDDDCAWVRIPDGRAAIVDWE